MARHDIKDTRKITSRIQKTVLKKYRYNAFYIITVLGAHNSIPQVFINKHIKVRLVLKAAFVLGLKK